MKFLASLVFLSAFVVSCGSNPPPVQPGPPKAPLAPPAPATGKNWTAEQVNSLVSNCTTTGPQNYSNYGYSAQQWSSYCGCLVTLIATNFTYPEFSTNHDAILNAVYQQNADATCQSKAGFTAGQYTGQ